MVTSRRTPSDQPIHQVWQRPTVEAHLPAQLADDLVTPLLPFGGPTRGDRKPYTPSRPVEPRIKNRPEYASVASG